jgi:adenylate cyclase
VDLSADALVSQQHARLDYQAGQWVITDLDSRNGTFVNGQRVQSQVLRNGDEVQLGNTRMRFYAGQ